MRMDKLTSKFQTALSDAQSLALGQDHAVIEPAHVMKVLLDQEGGGVSSILTKANINISSLRSQIDTALKHLPKVEGASADVHISNDLNRILNNFNPIKIN